jgi:hypothetical protein
MGVEAMFGVGSWLALESDWIEADLDYEGQDLRLWKSILNRGCSVFQLSLAFLTTNARTRCC